jgi:hypothetical protein
LSRNRIKNNMCGKKKGEIISGADLFSGIFMLWKEMFLC